MRNKFMDFPGQITLEEYLETVKNAMAAANVTWAKGLVKLFVRDFGKGIAFEQEELEGVALYGLARAIKEFDGSKVAFRTFASKVIFNELMRHLSTYSRKSLKVIGLDEVVDIPDQRPKEDLDQLLDAMMGPVKDEMVKLGLYGLKMKVRGVKVKELEKRTGIPAKKWYRCMELARKELKMRIRKDE